MTLAMSVVTADGIVIAADSRTTYWPQEGPVRVLSDFTHKVFEVSGCAINTYGWAFLNGRNVAGHMAEFSATVQEPLGTKELAEEVSKYFKSRIDEHLKEAELDRQLVEEAGDQLGFMIGGYDEEGVGRVYEVTLPSGSVEELHTTQSTGAAWRGQTDVIQRLVKGLDLGLFGLLATEAGKQELVEEMASLVSGMEYVIPFEVMNLQDAVDFAVFLIRTTIDAQRLTYGVSGSTGSWPGVGGPIEIATVTGSTFEWVQRTSLQGERPAGDAER